MDIKIERSNHLKKKPSGEPLGFGQYFTDHMFTMDYTEGIGWHDAKIIPYGPIELDPACMVFHYAQETFEGLKAYKLQDGQIALFRPELNAHRLNQSNARLCMPEVPEDLFIKAIGFQMSLNTLYTSAPLCLQPKRELAFIHQNNTNSSSFYHQSAPIILKA